MTRPVASFNVTEFGAVGDGATDDTASFEKAMDAAHRLLGTVLIPPGRYVIDTVKVPSLVNVVGMGADTGRFTPTPRGGVNLLHLRTSTSPLFVVDGSAVTLESLTLFGNGSTAPLLRFDNGFESRVDRVRCYDVDGAAVVINRVNNNTWSDLFIDNCGSLEQAAMIVMSPDSATKQTNTLTCYNLTIERPRNVALDIAWEAHARNVVEFVRLPFLHIESPADEHSATLGNVDSLIRVGNIRHLDISDAFLYGGPGPLITHRQTLKLTAPLSGGIRLIGGAYLGCDAQKTKRASSALVSLEAGDDFAALGSRFARCVGAAIVIGPDYGPNVKIDPTCSVSYKTTFLADSRTSPARPTWIWPGRIRTKEDLVVEGHIRSDRAVSIPTIAMLPEAGSNPAAPALNGTDIGGLIYFGTGGAAQKGRLVRVTFAHPFTAVPAVVICPVNAASGSRPFYVAPDKGCFDIGISEVPLSGVGPTGFAFSYVVVG